MGLTLSSACGPADPLPGFDMRIRFNTDGLHRCLENDCSMYGLACGAVLGLRIVDAETTEDGEGNMVPKAVYVDRCIPVLSSSTMCALGDLDIGDLPEVPAKMLQLQIALWSPKALGLGPSDPITPETCPKDNVFDLQGIPRLTNPQPAFGGAVYFEAGKNAFVDLPLACPNPTDVNTAACLPSTVVVTAKVDDLETTIFVPPGQAQAMTVSIAKPTERQIDLVNTEWVIENANSHDLVLDEDALIPEWMDAVTEDFGNTACVLALDKAETRPTTSAHCTAVDPTAEELPDMRGFLVSETNREKFLAALSLPDLPPQGLVIGRVVDHFGNPLAGVAVRPFDDLLDVDVRYLNEGRDGTTKLTTSSNGYFFVTDAPFGTAWTAEHLDGRKEDGNYNAGLLVGKISVLKIEMQAP